MTTGYTAGDELIDRSLIGDSQVRFESYADEPRTYADVFVYRLDRLARIPVERLHRTPTFPWGPKPHRVG